MTRPEDCLAGGGEMGAMMRAVDWSVTPLGPVADWPQSLRTIISTMLESRFAMVVAWGPEFRFFYNDRYRPVLGKTKHPTALGAPAEQTFPEAWPFIGPLFNKTERRSDRAQRRADPARSQRLPRRLLLHAFVQPDPR